MMFVCALLQGGAARAEGEWIMAQTSLDEILPGVDVDAFVDQHKVYEYTVFFQFLNKCFSLF